MQAGERKLHLRLDPCDLRDVEVGRLPNRMPQQRGLADARLAANHHDELCPPRALASNCSSSSHSLVRPKNPRFAAMRTQSLYPRCAAVARLARKAVVHARSEVTRSLVSTFVVCVRRRQRHGLSRVVAAPVRFLFASERKPAAAEVAGDVLSAPERRRDTPGGQSAAASRANRRFGGHTAESQVKVTLYCTLGLLNGTGTR